eukprot:CAMPEP_0194161616 /NCGR_PEP_ID=MMETSP0152-20130528/79037_1 /TAXON_ID=1049557 /ORGANISM="Thalassiothrix antarctica, Strain L6-D1" /LENGTH=409 /DNA_ID=CAMNT_0038871423 /DNA_START=28 /DNA_END=1257 /DNA_ORIENTATION=+
METSFQKNKKDEREIKSENCHTVKQNRDKEKGNEEESNEFAEEYPVSLLSDNFRKKQTGEKKKINKGKKNNEAGNFRKKTLRYDYGLPSTTLASRRRLNQQEDRIESNRGHQGTLTAGKSPNAGWGVLPGAFNAPGIFTDNNLNDIECESSLANSVEPIVAVLAVDNDAEMNNLKKELKQLKQLTKDGKSRRLYQWGFFAFFLLVAAIIVVIAIQRKPIILTPSPTTSKAPSNVPSKIPSMIPTTMYPLSSVTSKVTLTSSKWRIYSGTNDLILSHMWDIYSLEFYRDSNCERNQVDTSTGIPISSRFDSSQSPAWGAQLAFDDVGNPYLSLWGGADQDGSGEFWLGMEFSSMETIRCVRYIELPGHGSTKVAVQNVVQNVEGVSNTWRDVKVMGDLVPNREWKIFELD